MKRLINTLALKAGVFISKKTSSDELTKLMHSLHPINAGYDLIRLGSNGDGGYLLPNDLDGIEALFSPGVGFKSDFEEDCAKMGIDVFLADASVDGPVVENEKFNFRKNFIGSSDSSEFMTLDSWVNSEAIDRNSDLMLQMDIEGFEYEAIFSVSTNLMNRFRIMIFEFHQLEQLWSNAYFIKISRVFSKILETHTCVHNHPNNFEHPISNDGLEIPSVMEFTFIRNDRIKTKKYIHVYPHKLDKDCVERDSLVLPNCWYAKK